MKKLILTICLAAIGTAAVAQGMTDAIYFGSNNYYGTARTMGMGNAVTAIGSDIGSVEINPAGSAVAGYSQISFSPGVGISKMNATYSVPSPEGGVPNSGYSSNVKSGFVVPSAGVTVRFPIADYGLKSITFGIVSNITNNYIEDHRVSGSNSSTSISGAFSLAANNAGMPANISCWSSPYGNNYSWNSITAYMAKMIHYNQSGGYYYGSAEGKGVVGGNLYQSSGTTRTGTNNDVILNFGGNVDDVFYFGLNFGIASGICRNNEFFSEIPMNPNEFPITPAGYSIRDGRETYVVEDDTEYSGCSHEYSLITSLGGVYAKFGVIALPAKWLRIGASVKTPTGYSVRERWQIRCATNFQNASASADWTSPEGDYSYNYRSPWEVNAGIAVTLGSVAMISADYEMTDFKAMRYSSGNATNTAFDATNNLIDKFCGVSHSLRTGVEFNLAQVIFFRLGAGFTTSPQKTMWDSRNNLTINAADYDRNWMFYETNPGILSYNGYVKDLVTNYSAGIGFRSRGSFFADLAVRMTRSQYSYKPYDDYHFLDCGYPEDIASPTVSATRRLWDVALTLGFRF